MDKRICLLACLVTGLASFFASDLLAGSEAKQGAKKNVSIPQAQLQMQVQQHLQIQSQLLKMYEERQNIQAAMETFEKNNQRAKALGLAAPVKDAGKAEHALKRRQSALAEDIKRLETQLNIKIK